LYVDPFLLWRSPSYQDKALHNAVLNSFNNLGYLAKSGKTAEAREQLIIASECDEVGLGVSTKRTGTRIGEKQATHILDVFAYVPEYDRRGFTHFEEIQFFVDGIAKDRVSDFACSFMKSFLIDFTIDQCEQHGIPVAACTVEHVYDLENASSSTESSSACPSTQRRERPSSSSKSAGCAFGHGWILTNTSARTAPSTKQSIRAPYRHGCRSSSTTGTITAWLKHTCAAKNKPPRTA
jgi:hypothetical protein